MSYFFLLLGKTLPIYFNIVLGFLTSRYFEVNQKTVAAILFYIIGPMVVFSATLRVELNPTVVSLPIFFYLFGSVVALVYLHLFKNSWPDSTGNILAFTAGTGNTGYFGISLALILFEPAVADIFIFTMLASLFYEATTGYYVTAKGIFTARESLKKVSRLPVLYAFIAGLFLNFCGVELPDALMLYDSQVKGTFSVLGMMLVGMGLAGLAKSDSVDGRFLGFTLITKHIFWPLILLTLILLDRSMTHFFNADLHAVMFLFAIVPLAGNTVTLAVLLKARPEKAALSVFFSTLLSIVYIPCMLWLYDKI